MAFCIEHNQHAPSTAGKDKNSSVIIDCIDQPREQRRAEFTLLHNLCPSLKKLVLPEMLSQAGNAQRDDHNAEHEPAEVLL